MTQNLQPTPETSVTRPFADRIIRLETEKAAIGELVAEVYTEAKAAGLDRDVLKALIKSLAADPNLAAEKQALLETYKTDYRRGASS